MVTRVPVGSVPLFRVPAGEHSQVSVVPHVVPGDVVLLCRQRHGLHALLQTQHAEIKNKQRQRLNEELIPAALVAVIQ